MVKNVYFLHHDYNMYERQSDGVEFCFIPEFYDNKIYFYCSEYSMFWNAIEDAGNFDKCSNFKLTQKIRPATLCEICNANLCKYIDSVKEYTIENNKILDIKYINLDSTRNRGT
jgi:hypothetical protein